MGTVSEGEYEGKLLATESSLGAEIATGGTGERARAIASGDAV